VRFCKGDGANDGLNGHCTGVRGQQQERDLLLERLTNTSTLYHSDRDLYRGLGPSKKSHNTRKENSKE
jgi:hypothetical protein